MAEETKKFTEALLSKEEKEQFVFVQSRIKQLQDFRKQKHYGVEIEKVWADADRDYIPHRLGTGGKKVVATDETKGWRGKMITLGSSNWQSDIANVNPFTKITTALSILVDRNPTGIFTPKGKKFEAVNTLIKQLYQRSWEIAKSKQQLKLFILNLAKYGWSLGRTSILKIERDGKILFNDVYRETLDPWNCWIDDMAKPNDQYSIRDWSWRKIYSKDVFDEKFSKFKFGKMVEVGGNTSDNISANSIDNKEYTDDKLIEVYFYENVVKNQFVVIANGVPVVMDKLPISNDNTIKLSLWQTYWNLRHSQSPYGIGIYEAMRYDNGLLDRIRNMTIDQLTLSIYKMFFFQGTQALSETGDIQISPGVGKQILDPKNIKFLEVAGPGAEAWKGIEMLQNSVEEASGITPTLLGEITGKTAYESAQAKESALGRLKFPLDNICDALEEEGYLTVILMEILYSVPEVYNITDPELIEKYIQEVGGDSSLFERGMNAETGEETFNAKVYPEFNLNMEEDSQGNLTESEESKFFRVKPKQLGWEGVISINPQSILTPSKQLDKALDLEMYNMLIPLFAQPPELYLKVAKSIVKLFDKEPKDILPDTWLNPPTPQGLFIDQQGGQPQGQPPQQMPGQGVQPPQTAEKMVSNTQMPSNPQSMVQKLVGRLSAPFRKV